MSDSPDTDSEAEPAHVRYRPRPAEIACGAGLIAGIAAAYAFIGLAPSLLAHHSIILETFAGTYAAIVTGGALARVGEASLFLVIVAPLATILLYDVFYWWAGRLWGEKIIAFYAKNNPRVSRWVVRAERSVRRRALPTLAVCYYLPIPNALIFLTCGTSGIPLWTFILGDVLGMLLLEASLVGLGWAIGHPAVRFVKQVGHYSNYVTIGLVVTLIVVAVIRSNRAARAAAVAADDTIAGDAAIDPAPSS